VELEHPRTWCQVVLKLEALVEKAANLLLERGPVVELDASKIVVVGDTHGFPEVSRWALKLREEEAAEAIVFLGDYVDRGPMGLENLELLLTELVEKSDEIVLLRGNHEIPSMNYYYGFYSELLSKKRLKLLEKIEELYKVLPPVALLDKIILLHGGIPCRVCRNEPEEPLDLQEIKYSLEKLHGSDEAIDPVEPVLVHILWNDPRTYIEWFAPSDRGPGIYYYGPRAWQQFLRVNNLDVIVRAHERIDGVEILQVNRGEPYIPASREKIPLSNLGQSVITVFSSLYHGQRAAALIVDLDIEQLEVHIYT